VTCSLAPARAATLLAGPGKTYATPCAAIAASSMGDVIEVDPVTYSGDTCAVNTVNLTLRAVGGRATLDAAGVQPAQRKGILVVNGDNFMVENLVFLNAAISDADGANAAGIRMQAQHMFVTNCVFRENQNGILATPLQPGGELTVEGSEFDHNGVGNGCNAGGCTHNMYINHLDRFTLKNSWSHNVETAHLVKSRASLNFILNNRIGSEGNLTSSRQIDLPNGGTSFILGNIIQKDATAGNPSLITYGEEGLTNTGHDLYVVNNTFVNARSIATFVEVAAGADPAVIRNNIFFGPGTPSSQGTVSSDNLLVDPLFVNAAAMDFHLTQASPARNHGVDPGTAGVQSLVPPAQYVHPLQWENRTDFGADCGAFQYATGTPPSSSSSSLTSSSAPHSSSAAAASSVAGTSMSVSTASSTPTSTSASVGTSSSTAAANSTGGADDAGGSCGCRTTHPQPGILLLACLPLLFLRRRR
jgi:hypothetical protein